MDHGKHPFAARPHLSAMDQSLRVGQITDGSMVVWMNTLYVHTIISGAIIEFGKIARFLVKVLKHHVILPVTSSMPVTIATVKTPMLTPQVGEMAAAFELWCIVRETITVPMKKTAFLTELN
jgi:hypothetical protein